MGVAVVVLGCKLGETLARRARAGADAWRVSAAQLVVASGGRTHDRGMEADWLAATLVDLGVPADCIVRERCSHTTRENARFSSRLLERRSVSEVVVVTCSWHLPRAVALFEREGLRVSGWPTSDAQATAATHAYRRVRDWVAMRLDRST